MRKPHRPLTEPGVAHAQHEASILHAGADLDLSLLGKLDRVAEQVEEHLRESPGVAVRGR